MLFSGSVKSNIAYGRQAASDGELGKAAAIAQAAEFIEGLPGKMDGPIAQGGSNVSGGQKQRLSIARALVKKAPVVLFDDSFSALDYRTDASLRRALKEELSGSTIIIVAQRISTIMQADKIDRRGLELRGLRPGPGPGRGSVAAGGLGAGGSDRKSVV